MKLNNRGFAITAVLYGLLILFVILVSSYLLVQAAKKDRVDLLTSEIEESYRETTVRYEISLIDQNNNITYPSPKYIRSNSSVTIQLHILNNVTEVIGAAYTINKLEDKQYITIENATQNVKIYYKTFYETS